jgi:ribosome-dependent ATPase
MNEAERCDRISLMHAGKVLAQGTPAELKENRTLASLEEVFLAYLEEAAGAALKQSESAIEGEASPAAQIPHDDLQRGFSLGRLWAFARREAVELRHDYIRLAFALLGPIILMIVFGYGISLDIEHLPFSVFDQDGSATSRDYADSFRGSVYFDERAPLHSDKEMDKRLRSGELRLVIEIPPGFGKDLQSGRSAEIGAWLDAAVPFRAEVTRGYVEGVNEQYLARLSESKGTPPPTPSVTVEPRFRYNQEFKSVYAMVPADIMLILILIPAMMTALSVVREKEMGSIANFYAAPATKSEFLLGKQLPYFGLALANSASLILLAVFLFKVPLKGSWETLAVGSMIYVLATTAFGILISVLSSTQTAAIFAAAIITILPAQQFSGMLVPVSSLASGARLMGSLFPSAYFQKISVGTFTKALGFAALSKSFMAIAVIFLVYFIISMMMLAKQER